MAMNAQEYFNAIPIGHKNALKRPSNKNTDRMLRLLIEDARLKGRLIINNGAGYFEADPHDEADVLELKAFIAKQKSRIKKTVDGIKAMEYAYQMADQYSIYDMERRE